MTFHQGTSKKWKLFQGLQTNLTESNAVRQSTSDELMETITKKETLDVFLMSTVTDCEPANTEYTEQSNMDVIILHSY